MAGDSGGGAAGAAGAAVGAAAAREGPGPGSYITAAAVRAIAVDGTVICGVSCPARAAFSSLLAASQSRWNLSVSPPSVSTMSSRSPHLGTRDSENAADTVVWLQPTSFAISRRLGQPATWCSSCSASERTLIGPSGTFGFGSAPTRITSPAPAGPHLLRPYRANRPALPCPASRHDEDRQLSS